MIKLSVNETGPELLFFVFRLEYLISGPKSYRDFRKTAPGRPDYDVLHTKRAYSMYRPSAFSIALPEEDWRDIRCILNEEE